MQKELKEQLDLTFQYMKANLAKVDLLSMYGQEVFSDFPKNTPPSLMEKISKDNLILDRASKMIGADNFNVLTEKHYDMLGASKESYRLISNISCLQTVNEDFFTVDYIQVLYKQEFISLYSYLEGYFQDVQRILFLNDKSLLVNQNKEIPLNSILEKESYEELIQSIIEEKLEKSGYDKISDIIMRWKKDPYKIILRLKKNELDALDKFTCVRNVIVHNNSKVNNSLLRYLDDEKYCIGDVYILDTDVMAEYRDLIFNIVFFVYTEICDKYPEIVDEESEWS